MLILSQDGRVARHIIGSHDIAKEYMVDVEGPDLDSDRARLKIVQRLCGKDFMLEDRKLLPVEAKWAGEPLTFLILLALLILLTPFFQLIPTKVCFL